MSVYRQALTHTSSRPERATVGVLAAVLRSFSREIQLWWSFSKGDLTATILPATTFAMAACASAHLHWPSVPLVLLKCLLYFWLYIYTFNLSNQLTGIEEDRLNKPHRPLVVGMVSIRGAWWRLFLTTGAFLVFGAVVGVLAWTVLWVVAWTFHNHLGGARAAWGKNLAMVAGTVAQLAAAWQIVIPLSSAAWTWILAIALPLGLLVSLQDLRDVDGDVAIGRKTAIALVGEKNARVFFCSAFSIYPIALNLAIYRFAPPLAALIGAVGTLLSFAIAYRVIWLRTRKADHTTYMMYTYWYCLTLLSAVFWFAG